MKLINGGVCAAKGFKASGVHCGIRKNKNKLDLALVYSEKIGASAAVYTTNRVKGAPIIVTKENIADGKAQVMVCNSGIANTCCDDGIEKAEKMCTITADALGIDPKDIIVASTGVIGQPLPIEKIEEGMPELVSKLSYTGNDDAAQAIMTTDTHDKQIAFEFELDGKICHIGGMAKGSGMIHPNMATMLVFITTDVAISSSLLKQSLSTLIDDTFNMISIDGDTSTNDTVSIIANGMAGNTEITDPDSEDYKVVNEVIYTILEALSKEIAKDGEGATRLVTCNVTGAPTKKCAKAVAKSVITSNLLKCAIFGADANWGRILCAIGYTQVDPEDDFVIDHIAVDMSSKQGKITVCKDGKGVDFSEEEAAVILKEDEIVIDVDMGLGDYKATAWGCDLTYDYVKINGDYRT